MTMRLGSLLAVMCVVLGCRGDSASMAAPSPGAARGSAALPPDRQCLAANVCGVWSGCALIATDAPGRWSIVQAEKLGRDAAVTVENVCTNGAACTAAKAIPKGVVCVTSRPVQVAPPTYACGWDGVRCQTVSKP